MIDEAISWLWTAAAHVPGRLGNKLRWAAARLLLGSCGSKVEIGYGTWFNGGSNIDIASDVGIGRYCSFESTAGKISVGPGTRFNANVSLGADFGEINIGRDVLVGMNTVFRAADHRFDQSPELPIRRQGHKGGLIKIGDDVWLGANVVVVAGVEIGAHSVVGAGSVVTSSIPSGSVAAGVPARVLRTLGSKP